MVVLHFESVYLNYMCIRSTITMSYVNCSVARRVLDRYQNEGLTLSNARVTVQLVDGAVCGASLKGSCAIEVMGTCRTNVLIVSLLKGVVDRLTCQNIIRNLRV